MFNKVTSSECDIMKSYNWDGHLLWYVKSYSPMVALCDNLFLRTSKLVGIVSSDISEKDLINPSRSEYGNVMFGL